MSRPTNLRRLRLVQRPYDHERDDDLVWVGLTPIEWSVLVAGANESTIQSAKEVAARVADEVMRIQHRRILDARAELLDAHHDLETGA